MTLQRRLLTALLALLIVVMIAAAGYRVLGGPHVNLLDAIYMAVITFASIGYGEIVDTSGNPALRIFNMVMILFGIGIMLYVFSVSTAFIVEGELKDIFRRRKMLKLIRDMQDHFVICGAGETAFHVVQELLKTGNQFVVIDHDEERLAKIRLRRLQRVEGFSIIFHLRRQLLALKGEAQQDLVVGLIVVAVRNNIGHDLVQRQVDGIEDLVGQVMILPECRHDAAEPLQLGEPVVQRY